jgi:starch-binding outer membrane protein, SusD/RagB family
MKKFFKNKLTIALTALITVGACDDFLDRQPVGRYTTETYPGGGLDQFIYGMYSELRTWGTHSFPFVGIMSIRSDDADKGSTPADAPDQIALDQFTVTSTNGLVKDFYQGHYSAINKANVVINTADSVKSTISEEEYNSAVAEARFTRGYLYFNLVRAFGGVPKVDALVTDAGNFNIPRASSNEIYDLIEADLAFAADNLPLVWPVAYIGRPTKGSAQGLLSKVFLYRQKWQQAYDMAMNVINSGVYDLSTPFAEIFTEKGENSKESVFEIQQVWNENFKYGGDYARVQGVRGSGSFDFGWGFNVPSEELDTEVFEAGDPRKQATILYAGETTKYGETLPPFGPSGLPNPRYNEKVYSDPNFRTAANSLQGEWMNVRILRFADVVLIAAEAANELGLTTEALEKLNSVRARASASLPVVTTMDKDEIRAAIQHERRVEFALEHERFYDLVRWGLAESVLHAAGFANYTAGIHELLPIPQDEIDRSNGVLTQNFGY